jgi:hypothetical protein
MRKKIKSFPAQPESGDEQTPKRIDQVIRKLRFVTGVQGVLANAVPALSNSTITTVANFIVLPKTETAQP